MRHNRVLLGLPARFEALSGPSLIPVPSPPPTKPPRQQWRSRRRCSNAKKEKTREESKHVKEVRKFVDISQLRTTPADINKESAGSASPLNTTVSQTTALASASVLLASLGTPHFCWEVHDDGKIR